MWRRPVLAGALLLAIYVSLSFLNSPRGFLGTDTGGKVATLEVMTNGPGLTLDPDLGYWAERWDPDGSLHPTYYTAHIGRRWVNVTTLPMLYAAAPLYDLGGYRLALLLPMLGAVAAAFAARALVLRMGRSPSAGWFAFWVIGAASPMAIYALDFWEHSVGVALMAWAVVLLWDVVDADARSWGRSLGAGAALGLSFTLRTEALVYTAAAGLVVAIGLLLRRRAPIGRIALAGMAAAVGFGVVAVANEALERMVLDAPLRTARAVGVATTVAGDAQKDRITEAAFTVLGAEGSARGVVIGAAFVALVVYALVRSRTDVRAAVAAGAGAGVLLVVRIGGGLGFVPGMLVAWPFAIAGAVGVVVDRRLRLRLPVAIGAVALPVVLATQFRGGAAPQWAGRYILTTGLLLATAGVAFVLTLPRVVRHLLTGLAGVVTVFGLVWLATRSHDVDRTIAAIDRRPEPVVVSTVAHLAREGGATYGDRRWLTAVSDRDVREAAQVVRLAGERELVLVELADERPRAVDGWEPGAPQRLRLFDGIDLRVTPWRFGGRG